MKSPTAQATAFYNELQREIEKELSHLEPEETSDQEIVGDIVHDVLLDHRVKINRIFDDPDDFRKRIKADFKDYVPVPKSKKKAKKSKKPKKSKKKSKKGKDKTKRRRKLRGGTVMAVPVDERPLVVENQGLKVENRRLKEENRRLMEENQRLAGGGAAAPAAGGGNRTHGAPTLKGRPRVRVGGPRLDERSS
jgi:hypothetical protein